MENKMDAGLAPIFLQNERLTVEIAQPGEHYDGTRFDWSGFITQVTLEEGRIALLELMGFLVDYYRSFYSVNQPKEQG